MAKRASPNFRSSLRVAELTVASLSTLCTLFQVSAYKPNQIFCQFLWRFCPGIRMRDVQPNVIFQDLRHQAVHATSNRRQQHQDVRAFVPVSHRVLDGSNLSREAFDPRKQLLFFFRDFREFVFHKIFFVFPALFC